MNAFKWEMPSLPAFWIKTIPKVLIVILILAVASAVLVILVIPPQAESINYAEQLLLARAQRTSEQTMAIEAITYQFYMNASLNELLKDYAHSTETYDVSKWNSVFSTYLEGMAEATPELEDAMFFDSRMAQKRPLTMTDSLTRKTWSMARTQSQALAERFPGQPVWTFLQVPSPNSADPSSISNYLVCSRIIKNVANGDQLGLLILLLNPERLATTVAGSYWADDPAMPKSDLTVLVNEAGIILGGIGPGLIGLPASKVVPGFDIPKMDNSPSSVLSGRYSISQSILSRPSRRYWVIWRAVPEKPWRVYTILPYHIDMIPRWIALISGVFILILSIGIFLRKKGDAQSLLLKPEALEMLKDFSQSDDQSYSMRLSPEETKKLASLTERERAILIGLGKGRSNKEIASDMGLREQTVKNYLSHLYRKLDVHDRVGAAFFSVRTGLVESATKVESLENEFI